MTRPAKRVKDPETERALRSVSARIRRRQQSLQPLEEERNALVRQAIAAGWTHAQVAEATGLSRGRVGQIAGG